MLYICTFAVPIHIHTSMQKSSGWSSHLHGKNSGDSSHLHAKNSGDSSHLHSSQELKGFVCTQLLLHNQFQEITSPSATISRQLNKQLKKGRLRHTFGNKASLRLSSAKFLSAKASALS